MPAPLHVAHGRLDIWDPATTLVLAVGLLHAARAPFYIHMYMACVRAGSVTYHQYRANMTAFRIYSFLSTQAACFLREPMDVAGILDYARRRMWSLSLALSAASGSLRW